VRIEVPGQGASEIDLDRARLEVEFGLLAGYCLPLRSSLTLNGTVRLHDELVEPALDLEAQSTDFRVVAEQSELGSAVQARGRLRSACFGEVAVDTPAATNPVPGAVCPGDGVVGVSSRSGRALTYPQPDGGLRIDDNADGRIDRDYPSCLDATLRTCP
jgi:hypothetical protein